MGCFRVPLAAGDSSFGTGFKSGPRTKRHSSVAWYTATLRRVPGLETWLSS